MSTTDAIAAQRSLLIIHRERLAILLEQQARFGFAYAPPHVISEIRQLYKIIEKIKAYLREHGDHVDDLPTDLPENVSHGIMAIIDTLAIPAVRAAAITFRAVFESNCKQIERIRDFKDLHDKYQELELLLHCLVNDLRVLENNRQAWEDLTISYELEEKIEDLCMLGQRETFFDRTRWTRVLQQIQAALNNAIVQRDSSALAVVVQPLRRILDREPTRANARLVDAAHDLQLHDLITALNSVCAGFSSSSTEQHAVRQIEMSVKDLTVLHTTLQQSVRLHQMWQDMDDELRRVEANMVHDADELVLAWPDLQSKVADLYNDVTSEGAESLRKIWRDLELAVASHTFDKINAQFHLYRHKTSRRFRQIDDELLRLCANLQRIGDSLSLLLRALE